MKKFLCTLLLTLGIGISFASEHPCAGIDNGTKAYNDGDFERAIDEWKTCIDNGSVDPDLYYNLGNAYFRNKNLGLAIYNYKMAQRLKPSDEDIQHNLSFAQAMTKDKVDNDEEENPILSGLFKVHHALSLKAQLTCLLILFWAIIFSLLAKKFVASDKKKNLCIGTAFAIGIVFCGIAISAAYKVIVIETNVTGVVTATDADVSSAPNPKAQILSTLSEGTSFDVLSIQGNFVEIRLGDKIKGFVSNSDVGIVK